MSFQHLRSMSWISISIPIHFSLQAVWWIGRKPATTTYHGQQQVKLPTADEITIKIGFVWVEIKLSIYVLYLQEKIAAQIFTV